MSSNSYINFLSDSRKRLNKVSPSFCIAKWLHATIYLHRGATHSCHHPTPHGIPQEGLAVNPARLHNTVVKLQERQEMLLGNQPQQCNYCWVVENAKAENVFSDRITKSSNDWALPFLDEVRASGLGDSIVPRYLEVSFSKVCQMQCLYCNPLYSSKWEADVQQNGDYPSTIYASLLKEFQEAEVSSSVYINAFWDWWPILSKNLKVFRITGGEPLLSKETWGFLDKISLMGLPDMDIILNSNLSLSESTIDRLSLRIQSLLEQNLVKSFTVVTSLEAVGKKAEFIRYGLDFDLFMKNLLKLCNCHPKVKLSITSTLQVFSVHSFSEYLEYICNFRTMNKLENLQIDPSFLRNPKHFSLLGATAELADRFSKTVLSFLNQKSNLLSDFEKSRLETMLVAFSSRSSEEVIFKNKVNFYRFVSQIEERKKISFVSTFPELEEYWYDCEKSSNTLFRLKKKN
jgi:organic radical activating enzyme